MALLGTSRAIKWRFGMARVMRGRLIVLPLLVMAAVSCAIGQPDRAEVAESRKLEIGGAVLQVDFAAGKLDLPIDAVFQHIKAAASAVVAYYGRFPVTHARVLIVPVAGRSGMMQGTTWGDMHGSPGFTRIRIGEHATTADLADDWLATHELIHMAFPSLPDEQSWMEEGLSTYIEAIARSEIGELTAKRVWGDMVRDMPKGEPQAGDQGIDRTHTWARTYWGGALFCLTADVAIRRETKNRMGLKDALRAIVAEGGTIDHDWALPRALEIGDRATGTHVLTAQYAAWKDAPVQVDLPKLWSELGVKSTADGVEFVRDAPLAVVREAIAGDAAPGHSQLRSSLVRLFLAGGFVDGVERREGFVGDVPVAQDFVDCAGGEAGGD